MINVHSYAGHVSEILRPHQPTHTTLDARAIRVLAHPLRARLLSRLRRRGPATATTLARALDTNTGATSYHLRQLASVGLVEDTGEGKGRERLWRPTHEMHSWSPSTAVDPDSRAASNWLLGYALRLFMERAEHWARTRDTEPAEWQDTAGVSDYLLHINAGGLHDLHQELYAVIERYRATPPGRGSRPVMLFLHAFPDDPDDENPT